VFFAVVAEGRDRARDIVHRLAVTASQQTARRSRWRSRSAPAVIAESTRKLVGNLFELEDLGAQDLNGIAGPVRAWTALRPASVESRFDALHATGLTELVGREEDQPDGACRGIYARRQRSSKAGQTRCCDRSTPTARCTRSQLLMRRWTKAKTGKGQVVLLSGEPGIGKSRLTAAEQK
jgi:hypothetical protein